MLLPLRAYTYKKRAFHYFLFDLCYYITIVNFIYIWIFPNSAALFVACYCMSHGSLASAVITWRNSLVFHDSDKVTSLFVHIYAPLTFTVIRYVSRSSLRPRPFSNTLNYEGTFTPAPTTVSPLYKSYRTSTRTRHYYSARSSVRPSHLDLVSPESNDFSQ